MEKAIIEVVDNELYGKYGTMVEPKKTIVRFENLTPDNQEFVNKQNYMAFYDMLFTAQIMIKWNLGFREAYIEMKQRGKN